MNSITLEKFKEPENWLTRKDLRKFLGMDKSIPKFNSFIQEIESLEDSYLYVYGFLENAKTYHKVRIADYINNKMREYDRQKCQKSIKKGA